MKRPDAAIAPPMEVGAVYHNVVAQVLFPLLCSWDDPPAFLVDGEHHARFGLLPASLLYAV